MHWQSCNGSPLNNSNITTLTQRQITLVIRHFMEGNAESDNDQLMFQLLNHTCSMMSKLKLQFDTLSPSATTLVSV